jgi:photosystem II stability/assembly factor-like uncharacterized protein
MAIDEAISLVDIDVCRPEKCPGCDPQEDCVVVAVSNRLTAVGSFLYLNYHAGDLDEWEDGITLANWTNNGEDATSVLCLGDFILATSNGAAAVYYTDDLGATLVEHEETDWSDGPNCSDGVDQSFIVLVADSGHIWGTYDAARTWEILDDGVATAQHLTDVMIARDNPQVIYAVGGSNAVVKTDNGGRNWYALTGPCAGDAITALLVRDQYHVLIGNDDGEIWETSDGGETWTQQDTLPELPAAPIITDFTECGCDGLYATMMHTNSTNHRIYRNVEGGASGRWYIPDNVATPTYELRAVTCCDINRAIAVGGDGATNGNVILLA